MKMKQPLPEGNGGRATDRGMEGQEDDMAALAAFTDAKPHGTDGAYEVKAIWMALHQGPQAHF